VEIDVSELDVAKEQIAYLKFWLGVMVVTDISLFGWLISNATSTTLQLLVGGCLAVIAITTGIALLHRRIERQIQALRGL
jgi:nitrate reductase gamma subunit